MKKATTTEAKNNLSALIDGLKNGSPVLIDRGRPVARLEPVLGADQRRMEAYGRRRVTCPPDHARSAPPT